MSYEIEIDEDEKTVTILSEDEGILENGAAMAAVSREVRSVFGAGADTVGRGCSYFDPQGREAGWIWDIKVPSKDEVSDWETVTTYVSTFPADDGEGACDVEVQIGEDEGVWFLRTQDDAGGSDDADDTQYASEAEARSAAEAFAKQNDEGNGASAEDYIRSQREERAEEGEDSEGEFALYWETSLEDGGERTRYSTYEAACAAADLAQGKFNASNPRSGGVTYLCGFSVRRMVDGQWVPVDENGEPDRE